MSCSTSVNWYLCFTFCYTTTACNFIRLNIFLCLYFIFCIITNIYLLFVWNFFLRINCFWKSSKYYGNALQNCTCSMNKFCAKSFFRKVWHNALDVICKMLTFLSLQNSLTFNNILNIISVVNQILFDHEILMIDQLLIWQRNKNNLKKKLRINTIALLILIINAYCNW